MRPLFGVGQGHCFIDKSNLNGETTLEVMNSLPELRAQCPDVDKIMLHMTYEAPNKRYVL